MSEPTREELACVICPCVCKGEHIGDTNLSPGSECHEQRRRADRVLAYLKAKEEGK